jgi:hypothetical protein
MLSGAMMAHGMVDTSTTSFRGFNLEYAVIRGVENIDQDQGCNAETRFHLTGHRFSTEFRIAGGIPLRHTGTTYCVQKN